LIDQAYPLGVEGVLPVIRTGSVVPQSPWQPAPQRFLRITGVALGVAALFALAVPLAASSESLKSLFAGCAYLLLTIVVLAANLERQRRDVASRRLAHRLMFVGWLAILGFTAVGYLIVASTSRPLDLWVVDVPLLVGIPLLVAGLVLLCWPPGTTAREGLLIGADMVMSAAALLVPWLLVVVPTHPLSSELWWADLAPWAQYVAVIGIVMVAAASRRPGALPIQQVVLLQLSVLIYVNADIVQHLLGVTDSALGSVALILGALACAVLYWLFAQRPALEDEDEQAFALRTIWAVVMPAGVLVAMVIVVGMYRMVSGPIPTGIVGVTIAALGISGVVTAVQRVLLARDLEAMRMARVRASLEESAKAKWFTALLAQAHDLVTVVDRKGQIVFQTPSVETLFGFSPNDLVGRHVSELFHAVTRKEMSRFLQESIHTALHEPLELVLVDANANHRETETVILPLRADGADGYVLTTRDVTDRLRLRAALAESGHRDALTGLNNRPGFLSRLAATMATFDGVAVVLLDVVGFRDINDSRGHSVGDAVLVAVSSAVELLPTTVAVAGRIGADEFALVVVCDDVDREVGRIDRLLREALHRVILGDGSSLEVNFALGFVTRLPVNDSAADLVERADLALSAARTSGSRVPVKYERGMRTALVARLRQEADLRAALNEDRVVVHYQPIVELPTGKVSGVEALVRLRGPDGSLVPPDQFIPQAEELGLIGRLGQRVVEHAASDIHRMMDALGRPISVAVNVSAAQIEPHLPELIARALDRHDTPANLLTIEVTESALVEHAESAAILGQLRRMGCAVALDDFGTGYSSLSYLVGLPVDELKIDRSFIGRLADSERSLDLVRVLLQMASTLGFIAVAEGVETVEHADLLRGMGCPLAQGYLYAAPMPIEDLLAAMVGPDGTFSDVPQRRY
jgi:diguanylate cyclase (GGDEF)-like protein/PAS domain S-box-containing protein